MLTNVFKAVSKIIDKNVKKNYWGSSINDVTKFWLFFYTKTLTVSSQNPDIPPTTVTFVDFFLPVIESWHEFDFFTNKLFHAILFSICSAKYIDLLDSHQGAAANITSLKLTTCQNLFWKNCQEVLGYRARKLQSLKLFCDKVRNFFKGGY